MKNSAKSYIGYTVFALALSAVIIFGCRCTTSKSAADPLASWIYRPFDDFTPPPGQLHHYHLDKAITDDYQNFIAKNKLSPGGAITGFFEDGTGQRAVEFEAFDPNERPANASWHYVFVYNKENARIKIIKYDYRKYQSRRNYEYISGLNGV